MTEVDSLALCQLSYLKFDGMVPGIRGHCPSVTLESLKEHPDYEKLFADVRFEAANRALVEGMLAGKRFRDLQLNCYVNQIEQRCETQFSAVTYTLNDGTVYVAYRGTDETIVGWKENFNMAFLSPVPGQEYSVWYLNAVGARIEGFFYLGGHSKGGNFAVYGAMNCNPKIQKRILQIFCLDGPGFRPEVLDTGNYDRIADRVIKILPQSSIIGMLFEADMHFQVVESMTFGLMQHDPYTWLVEKDHLKAADDIYVHSKKIDNTLNKWIISLSEEQIRIFVDTLFRVISASRADNLIDMAAEWKRSMNGIITALKEIDEETEKILKAVIRALFDIASQSRKQNRQGRSRRKE